MGSIIYTYQRSKRKAIPLTDERIATLKEHEKFLKKMGVSSKPVAKEPAPLKLERPSKQLPTVNIKDMDWSPCYKRTTNVVSGDYVVGQAYNKGNYQVLSTQEAADKDTGKRWT